MRRNSCSFDISRLNTPTVMSVLVPTCCAMFSTRLVFPIDGRAAMNHQVRRLQPRGHLVEIGEAGRHAGDQLLARVQLLDRVEAALRQVAQRDEAVAHLVVGDREDRVLGLIEDQVGFVFPRVRRRENLVGGEDQVPKGGLLLDDLRVVLDVGVARHAVDQRRNVGRPPTSSRSPDRPSSSFRVTRSIASLRSASLTILSKMRRWASRKKSWSR